MKKKTPTEKGIERMNDNIGRLAEPFDLADLEFRIARSGEKNGKVWAMALTYITARAIMDRLDEVCGPDGWQTEYRDIGGSLSCGIGIRVEDGWVWKWDGTGHLETNPGLDSTDAGKGDYSNALKRAGVQWGIGRYLYGLTESFANVHDGGALRGKCAGKAFRWDPPDLPEWALPRYNAKPDIRAAVQQLLNLAASNGNVTVEESAKIEAALEDADTSQTDLEKTQKVLHKWVADKREAREAVPA